MLTEWRLTVTSHIYLYLLFFSVPFLTKSSHDFHREIAVNGNKFNLMILSPFHTQNLFIFLCISPLTAVWSSV